jgi:sporulation and spore germination protein
VKRWLAVGLLLAIAGCGGRREESGDGASATGASQAASPAGAPPPEAASRAAGGAAGESGPLPPAPEDQAALAGEEENRKEVLLFFQKNDDDLLAPEPRKILPGTTVIDQGKQVVAELIAGPRTKGLLPTVPEGTTVLGLYLDRAGTAYLDLSDEFVSGHPCGSSEELATVFSIVDSLTYNLPEIKRVRFLVGGEERETLHSHLDLRRSYLKNMSMVKMEAGG